MKADTRTRDVVLLLVAALAFATSGPLGKASTEIHPFAVASARTGIAAILLFVWAPRATLSSLRALDRARRLRVLLAGALLGAHFALFLAGIANTSLASAVALISLEPLAVVLVAFLAFGLRPTGRECVGLGVATFGAIVVATGAGVGEHRVAGDLMVLGAVLLFGAYVGSARGLRDALPGLPYVASVYGTASVLLLPLALLLSPRTAPPSSAVLATVAMGLVPTLVGHTLVQLAARRAAPSLVALVCPGETLGSLAIGALVWGTRPTAREGIGAVFVLLGATLAITGAPRSAPEVTPAEP